MKILIIDDSSAMRKIIQKNLRVSGFDGHEILEADNGVSGIEAVEKHSPDLVLSDWNMPEMTGIELLKSIRDKGSKVPFGFITTESTQDMRQLAFAAGAQFLLGKPFTPEQIFEAVNPFLTRK
jgi:two-component system chemotaxis response regulator CheY